MSPRLQFWMPAVLSLFGTLIVVVFTAWFNTRALSAQMDALRAESKAELVAVRAEFKAELVALRGEVSGFRGEFNAELAALRGEMGMLRAELKQAVAELELRLSKQILELTQRVERVGGSPWSSPALSNPCTVPAKTTRPYRIHSG